MNFETHVLTMWSRWNEISPSERAYNVSEEVFMSNGPLSTVSGRNPVTSGAVMPKLDCRVIPYPSRLQYFHAKHEANQNVVNIVKLNAMNCVGVRTRRAERVLRAKSPRTCHFLGHVPLKQ